jgi:hypothetical protein
MINPESVDLARLTAAFARRVPEPAREGFVVGRTNLRDCVISETSCSEVMAEQLVETMVTRGFIRYLEPQPGEVTGRWVVSQD